MTGARALLPLVLVAVVLAWLAAARPAAPPLVGDAVPSLRLPLADGGEWSLQDYHGRVVVLNLWATWCAPCRAEMPALQRLWEALPPERFAVVGISVDEDGFLVEEFLQRLGVSFDVVLDRRGDRSGAALETRGLPETFLIRADGVIAERILGEQEWDGAAWLARILALDDGEA